MTRDEFVATTNRFERYQWADKILRFFVYRWMENYVVASCIVWLALPWIDDGLGRTLILGNVWVVAAIGVLHHVRLALMKPWLLCAAISLGGIVWALGGWLLGMPHIETFCVVISLAYYWTRGEQDVNERAYAKFLEVGSQNDTPSGSKYRP